MPEIYSREAFEYAEKQKKAAEEAAQQAEEKGDKGMAMNYELRSDVAQDHMDALKLAANKEALEENKKFDQKKEDEYWEEQKAA